MGFGGLIRDFSGVSGFLALFRVQKINCHVSNGLYRPPKCILDTLDREMNSACQHSSWQFSAYDCSFSAIAIIGIIDQDDRVYLQLWKWVEGNWLPPKRLLSSNVNTYRLMTESRYCLPIKNWSIVDDINSINWTINKWISHQKKIAAWCIIGLLNFYQVR